MDGARPRLRRLRRREPRPRSTARSPASAAAPGAELPGYDLLVQALGGLMSITGEPDGEPQKVGVALVDVLAGLFATVGILDRTATTARRTRRGPAGRGRPALLRCSRRWSTRPAPTRSAGVVPDRMGNRHPSIAPYELLRDRRRRAGPRRRQRPSVRRAVRRARRCRSWPIDPRFATNTARVAAPGPAARRARTSGSRHGRPPSGQRS